MAFNMKVKCSNTNEYKERKNKELERKFVPSKGDSCTKASLKEHLCVRITATQTLNFFVEGHVQPTRESSSLYFRLFAISSILKISCNFAELKENALAKCHVESTREMKYSKSFLT